MPSLFAPCALLPAGWAPDVKVDIGQDGRIDRVTPRTSPGDAARVHGPLLPGLPNAHSHAFQRAMAGLAEVHAPGQTDDFWTWREAMFRLCERLTPEHLRAIAAQLYAELLRGGFTAVAEFHYLHRAVDGSAYAEPGETCWQMLAAARDAGIAITLLPTLYERGGFDNRPLRGGQRRFASDPEFVTKLLDALRPHAARDPEVGYGLALHSLRAVAPESFRRAVESCRSLEPRTPIHIHAAEQPREVADCLAATGQRPVEWLLAHADLDTRWTLIHATQTTTEELARAARTGACIGLCPSTEANLGDGLFDLTSYLTARGRFAIGTDSHVGRETSEELRWLEYGQRLQHRRRNVTADDAQPAVATHLWQQAAAGGAQALGRACGAIAAGNRADLVVLDGTHADLLGLETDAALGAFVFSAGAAAIAGVMVGGHWVVQQGRHVRGDAIAADYRAAIAVLRA